ncbi:MAG TPA: CHAT domain-containing protein, partial [Chloroflexota bacterium]|nr:CHAT domain-containing protein [Chloroflexota bacterium]
MKRLFRSTMLLCVLFPLSLEQPPLLAQPAPGAVTPAASPQPDLVALLKQGDAARAARKFDEALPLYEQALDRARALKDRESEAHALTIIGEVYRDIGQPQKALEFLNQALLPTREAGNKRGEADALGNIGGVYWDIGQPQKALESLNQALLLARESGYKRGEAQALRHIGRVYRDIGQPQKALEFLNQALPLRREAGDKSGEAVTLNDIGGGEELQGQLAQAGNRLRAALSIYEEIRETLAASSENKVSFLQQHLPVYHRYINLLLKQSDRTSAFEWTQKTKARALLDLMSSGKVDISKGTSTQEQERERELKRRIGQINRQLLDEAVGHSPDKKARINALKEQVAQAQRELAAFTDALYAKYPELARKRAARTVSLQEVARFLPPDTALLEYVVLQARGAGEQGLDKTVLFCITAKNGKATVSTYSIDVTRQQLTTLADDFRAACADQKKDYRHQARALYALLVAPADKQLAGRKRLIVCPDGPLWGLPFQALMTPSVKGQPSGSHFLIEQHELDYAYSATGAQAALLAGQSIKHGHAANAAPDAADKKPGGTLLVLANPDFGGPSRLQQPGASASSSASAPRPITAGSRPITAGSRPITADSRAITAGSRAITADSRAITLDLRATGTDIMARNGAIAPLPGTQLEADAIKVDFPSALVQTGTRAQEAIAKAEAPRHRFLHFATHGFFNDASPLKSAIVLAQPPASGAGSADDGLLTAREIFDLSWPADLVVLSAC